MNTVFMFPGQGVQYIGMAKDFYEYYSESKKIFDIASEVLGFDMAKLCFEENDNLNKTEYTQVAMLTASISILRAVEKEGLKADMVAGLSLGEYSALVANHTFDFEEAIKIVKERGAFMEYEVPKGVGAMSAILGMDNKKVEEICQKVSEEQGKPVELANYNCPGQIVISGEKNAILEANKQLLEAGAKRAIELNVSGPFHSSLLKGAGNKLAKVLDKVTIHKMNMPYIANITANIITDSSEEKIIKSYLEKQVYSPVKWQQSVEELIAHGAETFIEIGPGRTLSGFVKKIDRSKKIINIEKIEDLEKVVGRRILNAKG